MKTFVVTVKDGYGARRHEEEIKIIAGEYEITYGVLVFYTWVKSSLYSKARKVKIGAFNSSSWDRVREEE